MPRVYAVELTVVGSPRIMGHYYTGKNQYSKFQLGITADIGKNHQI